MSLKKNDDIRLVIEDMTSEGSSVGHYDSQAVFVNGAVAGDEVLAHVIKAKKNYAVAIVKQIITPSEDRIESDCPVSEKCGGCSFRNMSYDAELRYKYNRVKNAVQRIGHIDAPVRDVVRADSLNDASPREREEEIAAATPEESPTPLRRLLSLFRRG